MSGYTSKLSSFGAKGWGNLQNLWSEPKTPLNTMDPNPSEKSSLLGRGMSSHQSELGNSKLLHNDEDCGSWSDDQCEWNTVNAEDHAPDDQEQEHWLNDDKWSRSSKYRLSKNRTSEENWAKWDQSNEHDTKSLKSSHNLKKNESLIAKKMSEDDQWTTEEWWCPSAIVKNSKKKADPLVGKLLNLDVNDCANNEFKTEVNSPGWYNDVWTDDNDESQSLQLGSTNK